MNFPEYFILFASLPIFLPFAATILSCTSIFIVDGVVGNFAKKHSIFFHVILLVVAVLFFANVIPWALSFPAELSSESRWIFRDLVPFLNVSFR